MIQQVRRLARETGQVLTGGGHHGLDRLLADLLGDPRNPSVEQLGRVRARRLVARPLGHRAGEPRERAAGRFPETRGRTGVARRALLAYHVEHRVSVAVHAHLPHRLRVARGLTLAPQLEARATLALGFLLLAALVGGEVARRVRVPRILGYLLIGFGAGPAWLRLVRADELQALQFLADAGLALIAFAAGAELTLAALRAGRTALLRLTTGAVAFPFVVVTLVAWSVSLWLPIATHQSWHDRLAVALVLGTLAAAASPVVTTAMMGELDARGPFARSLLGVTVAQDLAVGVLFTLVLLVSKPLVSPGAVKLGVAGVAGLELMGSLTVGIVVGYLLGQYLHLGQRRTALLLVAAALLTSEIARALRLEPGLIALAAGFYLANFSLA